MTDSRWTVLGEIPDRPTHLWCRCACGTEKAVNRDNLRRGLTKSCGCLAAELSAQRQYKHGMARSRRSAGKEHPLYATWHSMIQRCADQNNKSYPNYGGRGISVCDRWRESFTAFLADVGEKPSPSLSLDRIDNDGDYEPGNVRWATASEQGRNRRLKTHCVHGHEFTPENTKPRGDGRGRQCVECERFASLNRSAKNHRPCVCGHRFLTHRYDTATRSNQGECLALGCGCRGFEERGENPLGMGGLSVATCENRGGETDGPDGALTPLPGPDLRVNSTTRGAKADA